MRLKLVFWLFLIAENILVSVQCQGNEEYSYRKRLTFGSRITGGDDYESKDDLEYPWLVGLHNRVRDHFFCAGSLISNRHVLSAAHCFHEKGEAKPTDPYHVMAMLARFNVSDHDEVGSLNSLVWKIFIHPEWTFVDWKSNYDADVSVVVLEDSIEFTAFIRPVRLPEPSDKTEVVGDGTVVGWGHDNNSSTYYEETPSKVEIPAVLFRDCVLNARKLVDGLSGRNFCAGFLGRSIAPCSGDSGGGFYVEDENRQNSIEGIVSNSAIQDTLGVCKTDTYTTYTIVANFVPWIKEKVQETKERVVKDVEYTCSEVSAGSTECRAEENDNPLEDYIRLKLLEFPGDPKDVRKLNLEFGKARVIEGISETFPNLEEINLNSNRIERRTFANMTKLKKLELYSSELITYHFFDDLENLEELKLNNFRMLKHPKSLFNVLRNLKVLSLYYGRTDWRILPGETFENMSKLKELHLVHIGLKEISENAFNDLVGLKELNLFRNSIKKLPNGLFRKLRNLKSINLSHNKIEKLSKELFANNLKLEEIDLSRNRIQKIETDFTLIPEIRKILLDANVCTYEGFPASSKTIQEFQKLVDSQCNQK